MKRILTMKCSILVRVISVFFLASFLAACGGGEDGSPGSNVSSLTGTWSGTLQASNSLFKFAVTVDNTGKITDIKQNGSSLGLTGTITPVQGPIFSFTLSDETEGGFMLDASGNHLGFLVEDGSFGGLRKNDPLDSVNFGFSNLIGTWSGYSVALDSSLDIVGQGSSTAIVNNNLHFTGSDFNGSFSGDFADNEILLGTYDGVWTTTKTGGNLRTFLSTDKSFAATWACKGGAIFPSSIPNCTFAIWNKQ